MQPSPACSLRLNGFATVRDRCEPISDRLFAKLQVSADDGDLRSRVECAGAGLDEGGGKCDGGD